jgi:DNA-binding transcriptional MerR regulator
MRYRVEDLAARANTSVDTIRFYQTRGLLPAPHRVGRLAWYDDDHLERLSQIRRLQGRGLSLAVIRRLLAGELDQADEELAAAVTSGAGDPPGDPPADPPADSDAGWLTLDELGDRSGIPLALLQAIERDGLLVPRRRNGEPCYTDADITAARAGLKLLEHGLPLSDLLDLARAHGAAMRSTAEQAVELFDRHVRHPLRAEGADPARLVAAFEELLPATLTIVAHHFRRTLLAVAQEHIERVGSDDERELVTAAADRPLDEAAWAG